MTTPAEPSVRPQSASPRWWRWLRQRRLRCAAGHHYPYKFRFNERAGQRCEHYIQAERRECGLWTYFIAMRGGGTIAVNVTIEELDQLEQLETGTEVIDFLGIFPDH